MPYTPTSYQAQQVQPRIAHIGLGAFHRAHMAWACHEVLQKGVSTQNNWGICALSLRGSKSAIKTIEGLEQQGYRYLLGAQAARGTEIHQVGSIVQAVDAVRDGIAAIVEVIAAAQTAIVSFTVTEKGYYLNAATRQLDEGHPDIQHDLTQLLQPDSAKPRTTLGYLALGLLQRQQSGAAGLALMSCDNIPGNSRVLRTALQRFIALLGQQSPLYAGLPDWLEDNCRFPCTMVDRITPAVTAETLAQLESLAGERDPIALSTEKFTQWVIEDNFPAGRPAWQEASGVTLVADEAEVELYEEMKLRMLNGSHSFLAYCGYLAGKEYIFECMQDEMLRTACYQFITAEQLSSLRLKEQGTVDLIAYAEELLERYSNPHIFHRCHQIAMDGSLKVPQRWLDGYRSAPQRDRWRWLPFALAAWLQYLSAEDLDGQPIAVQDPNAEALNQLLTSAAVGQEAKALFSFAPCFAELNGDSDLIEKVQGNYQKIRSQGLLQALSNLVKN